MLKYLLFFTLALTAHAKDWCSECKDVVEAFDGMDPTVLSNEICPIIGYANLCEDIAPYIIEWMQDHSDSDAICAELCSTGEDYDYMGDYVDPIRPFIADDSQPEPPKTPMPKDFHKIHHPFDIPHPSTKTTETDSQPEPPKTPMPKDFHKIHHPFDIPHPSTKTTETDSQPEPPKTPMPKDFHKVHHPFDIPHPHHSKGPLVEKDTTIEE